MNFKLIISVCLFFLLSFSLSAQTKVAPLTRKNVRITEKKPAVYIDFVKIEKRTVTETIGCVVQDCKPTTKTEKFDAVLLKFHNNSIWTIRLSIEAADTNGKFELKPLIGRKAPQFMAPDNIELDLEYGVEQINGEVRVIANLKRNLPYTNIAAVMTAIWLPSGRAVVFAVRREELRRNLQIFMPFKYDWEISDKNEGYDEPQHRAYFNWSQFENAAGL